MLLVKLLWHSAQARARRVHDQETGAINTVELLILIAAVVVIAGVVLAVMLPKVQQKANNIQF